MPHGPALPLERARRPFHSSVGAPHPEVTRASLFIGEARIRRAGIDDAATVEHDRDRREFERDLGLLLDDEDGELGLSLQRLEHPQELIDNDRRQMAGAWAQSVGLCIGLIFVSKLVLHVYGRAELGPFRLFSPSGHVAIATSFYGNLAILLARGRRGAI